MFEFSSRSKNCLNGIHPKLVRLMELSIDNSPIDFTITEGIRTTERQQELYAKGRTSPGCIVTNCDGIKSKSNHQAKEDGLGYAVDIYPYINGSVRVNDIESLVNIAHHIKTVALKEGVDIEWGGDWKMKDYPHFQLKC